MTVHSFAMKGDHHNNNHACSLNTSGLPASLDYRICTAKDICCCKCCLCHVIHSSRWRYLSSGHAICHRAYCKHPYRALLPVDRGNKMLVTCYNFDTTSSTPVGRPYIGYSAITPLSSEHELCDLLAGWHESHHKTSILPCFLV